jgi:AraC-like DNA-binding protein
VFFLRWKTGPAKRGLTQFCAVHRRMDPSKRNALHTHDFAEVFWIEEGRGQHVLNGKEFELKTGDLYLIRPKDAHAIKPIAGHEMGWINVSFPYPTVLRVINRYFTNKEERLWDTGPMPKMYSLEPYQLDRLKLQFNDLIRAPQKVIEIERFLLNLIHILKQEPIPEGKMLPDWLNSALKKIQLPEHFSKGTPELARLAGRCPEHVSRSLKQALGKTATEVINDARLKYAAIQLTTTPAKIIELCFDCGFTGLPHFYKIFKARYGMTPKRYRKVQQDYLP